MRRLIYVMGVAFCGLVMLVLIRGAPSMESAVHR